MKIAEGLTEDGIVVGNAYDKYQSRNPVVRWLMRGFESALRDFVARADPSSIHEVGCGEGYWVLQWQQQQIAARGCDFSAQVIALARANAKARSVAEDVFSVRSIYDLQTQRDTADLIVCCEVLEHLEDPEAALLALRNVVGRHLIVSVPREPLWCALNLVRGKYVGRFGNTPGHIQHWSRRGFVELIGRHFDIVAIKSPLPWTMLLCRPKA